MTIATYWERAWLWEKRAAEEGLGLSMSSIVYCPVAGCVIYVCVELYWLFRVFTV
jgi:hypothetical protein